jgi:hypothetical protein
MCKLRRFICGILHTQFAEVNLGGGLSRFSRRFLRRSALGALTAEIQSIYSCSILGSFFRFSCFFRLFVGADLFDGRRLGRPWPRIVPREGSRATRRINGKVKHEVADQIKLGDRTLTPEMAAKEW